MSFDTATSTYHSLRSPIPLIEDLDLHTFLFNPSSSSSSSSLRQPLPSSSHPLLIDSSTSLSLSHSQTLSRIEEISKLLLHEFQIGSDDVISIFSTNNIDFPLICWAGFRLGAIISPTNPNYTSHELRYQISHVKEHHEVKCLFVSSEQVGIALEALDGIEGLGKDKVVILDGEGREGVIGLEELVRKWKGEERVPPTPKLGPGGGRKKTAFISFSR
jgi:4-coumarate--CoA ligase